jgi:biopolymer transport protein ExbB
MDADVSQTGFKGTVQSTESGNPPVPNAVVQYTGAEDSGEAIAGKTGEFEVSGIRPGTYLITVSAEKYKTRSSIPVTVVQSATTPTEVKLRRKETLVTFAAKFGWVGIPLLLCSIGTVTFILERLWAYARLNRDREVLADRVYNALSQDNVMEAIQACEEQSTPMANVLKSGLLRYNQGLVSGQKASKAELQQTMQEGALLEVPEYERNLTWLSMIAVVAPLFGLLGTVMGMIKSFTVIALEGTNDPNALAGGISEALYTTAAGLTIAAPTLVFYAIFENIVSSSTIQIEVAATDTVNALLSSEDAE